MQEKTLSQFEAKLLQPKKLDGDAPWAFVILPKDVSGKLPRRGRITIEGVINGHKFQQLLEPDGKKSHWLKLDSKLLKKIGITHGDVAHFEIGAADQEPEPEVPLDLNNALNQHSEAKAVWESTTTVARVDWIHWVVSAKQAKTRTKRISDACDMLSSGKKRVCCFDPSGFYSKALKAPEAEE